ncbi:hypothetical protein M3Y94_00279200 [Aphelenchoides besseyi]|nr:hypothetical protein M3Y94_00279200 [Aphelenchoides besseyi]KAI6236012.1 hypothetical protein M3Y95_00112300 [Aphelenchoides besseyi]
MVRCCTILIVLLFGLAYAADNETDAQSTTTIVMNTTVKLPLEKDNPPVLPIGGAVTAPPITINVVNTTATNQKEGPGKGYGHENGRRYRGRHEDHDYHHSKHIVSPFPDVKKYFDTYYCSVHGSFALSFNEKVEDQSYDNSYGAGNSYSSESSYGGGNSYGGQENYGNNGGYGQSTGGGYGSSGSSYGSSNNQYGSNEGYGKSDKQYGGGSNGYSERKETKFIRKVTRQYCRYTASWSDKACKFCCRVVARSAYTNPDDITAAIFSFNPSNPAAGGAGIEVAKSRDYSPAPTYSPTQTLYGDDNNNNAYNSQGNYNGGGQNGYGQSAPGNQGGYEAQTPSYNSQSGNYGNQGSNYGNQSPGYQQPPPSYGNAPQPQYRNKRSNGYPAPRAEQYADSPSYGGDSSTNYGSESSYEDAKPVNQCVCCAPKHRYY